MNLSRTRSAALCGLFALAASPAFATNETTVPPAQNPAFSAKASFAYSFVDPSALQNFFGANLIFDTPYTFKRGLGFFAEGNYFISHDLFVGLRINYLHSPTGQHTSGNVAFDDSFTALSLYATGTYRLWSVGPWSAGAELGAGIPILFDYYTRRIDPGSDNDGSARLTAHPFTAFAAVSGEYAIYSSISTNIDAGYRYLRSSPYVALGMTAKL
jgi:hypothetical protein